MANITDAPAAVSGSLYRAFWRWHFYAGLMVLPLLMLMALTGGVYLFKAEIDGLIYRRLAAVQTRPALTGPSDWVRAAQARTPGRVVQLTVPARPDQAARLVVETATGDRLAAYVDPLDARVLGVAAEAGPMQFVKRLHSLDLAGPVANLLVEAVAGWAIVLATTGIVLWWPRGRRGGVVSVRGSPSQRLFWRDLHAVVGVFAAVVIIFLAATGMPWSAVWGQQVRKLTNEAGWGRPKAPAASGWSHGPAHKPEPAAVPWALQQTQMSGHGHGHRHGAPSTPALSLDQIVFRLDGLGLPRPYVLSIPSDPDLALSAAHAPDRVEDTRTVYLDARSGAPVADIRYADYGLAAKAIEWGISVHQGRQFGLINKLVMLGGCIAIWLLAVSGLAMWWKRRPKGRLAAPAAPQDKRGYIALLAVVAPLAILYPLVGASLCVFAGLDQIVTRLWPGKATP